MAKVPDLACDVHHDRPRNGVERFTREAIGPARSRSRIILHVTFDATIDFDPDGDFDAFLRAVPAKWVVYLMADAADRPVQLLCVRNLRYSLGRRLGIEQRDAPKSKRVDYRALVRKIHWRRVDSSFEADVVYLDAARQFFPQTYRVMTGLQPAWFIHVDADAPFPRFTKTTDLSPRDGVLLGPVPDRNVAAKFIEDISDWFDLCRYYNILIEAPGGLACAYKEMGKCPAPCDGSISMQQYRAMVRWSTEAVVMPAALVREHTQRMKQAAGELRFESAGRIKSFVDSIGQLGKGPLSHLRRLEDFNFLSLQRGPRQRRSKVFLITPVRIVEFVGLIGEPVDADDLVQLAQKVAEGDVGVAIDDAATERIGLVSRQLFSARKSEGVFLPLISLTRSAVVNADHALRKQKEAAEDESCEGVVREMRAM